MTATEENEVVVMCQVLADLGFPMNMDYVDSALREYLVKKGKSNPFGESGKPGRDWWSRFLKHHPEIAQRKPQHLTKARVKLPIPRSWMNGFPTEGTIAA